MPRELHAVLASGPTTGNVLRGQIGVSQPTLSRLLTQHRSTIAKLGRGRATRYALYRRIRELPAELPVMRVSTIGGVMRIGTLATIAANALWFDDLEDPRASREYLSLPWFITDMRPQGYLGRLFPAMHEDLGLPGPVTDWNEDQTLYAIARRGEDVVGNLLVGEESMARFLTGFVAEAAYFHGSRLERYGSTADYVAGGGGAGSSAAGEQPKFTACVREPGRAARRVIVKFSGTLDTAAGRRWADLLIAEHLATEVLREHGHVAARTEFLSDGRRAYLEIERFDRLGEHGRIGLVSLGALDDGFVGERRGWPESAAALLRERLIAAEAAVELRWLSAFGAHIANNDMHLGNVSFFHDGARQLRLAPVYDMLPMAYAPARDEVPTREPAAPVPRSGHSDQWLAAGQVAQRYWRRLADDERLSEEFRAVARQHLQFY